MNLLLSEAPQFTRQRVDSFNILAVRVISVLLASSLTQTPIADLYTQLKTDIFYADFNAR
jgi:hypothetical protein